MSEQIFEGGNLTVGLYNNSTEPHLCEHLLRVKRLPLLQPRGNETLLGAMPALTVNFVSSNTTRRISCTQSSADKLCFWQYGVMLAKTVVTPQERDHVCLLEVTLITSSGRHVGIVSSEYGHDSVRHFRIPREMV